MRRGTYDAGRWWQRAEWRHVALLGPWSLGWWLFGLWLGGLA